MRSTTIYREVNGEVIKIEVNPDDLHPRHEEALNFHQRIIKTYYELEREGKLDDMSPAQKARTRQIHEDAQIPAYWGEGYEKEYQS
jgi:hypothetical protein